MLPDKPDNEYSALIQQALKQCETEPIHQAGAIQPYGVLLALDSQLRIEYCSDNADQLLNVSCNELLGRNFSEFATIADIEQIRSLEGLGDWRSSAVLDLKIRRGDVWSNHDAAVSYHQNHWLVELELCAKDQSKLFGQVFVPTRDVLWQLDAELDLNSYTHKIAELVRRVTGYDRVMMYQFDRNWDGEVIAESRSEQMGSYLGNRFPASDIPSQARALYTRNLTRVIGDVTSVTVPVRGFSSQTDAEPLDMTYSAYRSMSPVHLEYLGNMGVAATLTISLIQNGKLWGMLACHHDSPKLVTLRERELYEFIGKTVSIKLSDLQRSEQQAIKERVTRFLLDAPIKQLDALDPVTSKELMSMMDASGVVLVSDGCHYAYGQTPSSQQIFELEQLLKRQTPQGVFNTDELAELHPLASAYSDVACGILLAPLNATMDNYLLWCRGRIDVTRHWAGEPNKDLNYTDEGVKISPRRSFASWTQTYHNKSAPWTELQVEVAETLAYAFIKQLSQQSLLQQEQDFRKLVELSNDMTMRLKSDGMIDYVSSAVQSLLGRSVESLPGTNFIHLLGKEDVKTFQQASHALIEHGDARKVLLKLQHADHHTVWVEAKFWQPEGDAASANSLILTVHDVSQRHKYQLVIEELHQRNALLKKSGSDQQLITSQAFLDQTSEAVVITGSNGLIESVNRSFCEITGYESHEAIGCNPSMLQSGIHTAHFYEDLWSTLAANGRWKGEIWNRRKNGEIYPQWGSISAVSNDDGSIRNYVAVFSDVSKAKEAENNLFFAQNHDLLTGLPNRQYCVEKVSQMVVERNQSGLSLAVVFLDIDGFKLLNDAQGHHTGDDFLRSVAQRLSDGVPENGLLCRWGADEFVMLLDQMNDRDNIAAIVQALFNSLAKPLCMEGHELIPSACVGISFYPEDAANAQGLIQAAETALYRAKERGPASIELFTPLLAERLQRKFEVASELRRAVEQNELLLHYQPQVDSKTCALVGVEALVRWQHPLKGLIPPGDFIPLAEELGLIELLGDYVLNKGMAQMADWRDQGWSIPRLAVNIAPQQLVPGFAEKISKLLATHQLPASMLELEITEGALARDDSIISLLNALRDMGVMLSIDDFGTGYSSLAHIKHLPVTCFKIDKAFVDGLPQDVFDVAIIRSVLALGHSLGISVLAEGVETEEQYQFLAEQGVDSIQGYYFAKPMAVNALEQWVDTRAQDGDVALEIE